MPETTTPAPAAEPATSETLVRRRHTRLLVVMSSMIVLAGTLVAVLFWLQPLRPPTLLPIFIITDSSTGERLPWEEQDLQGLLHDARLGRPLEPIAANPSRDEIRTRLRGLAFASKDRPVVLYLTGRVCVDQAGEVLLLPGDPRRDHARNRLPFAEILAGLRDSPARQKLLVVQFTPVTDPTICEASPSVISAAVFRTFDSVADPTRLCICSCIPGETPLAAAELGRTVFGHYLDSGLRGAADGWNRDGQLDGRVSAHELAAFVHVRVSAWAAANRQVKQTPVLIGDASDFSLRVLPSDGEGGRQLPEPLVYPEFLREAWKHEPRDSSLLIDLEQAWQGGRSNDEIKRLFESRQKEMEDRSRKLGSVARPTPPPTLALARTLDASDEALREELRAAIRRVESKPTLPDKTPAPLLPPELDPFKTPTPEVLGSAVLELLADDPAPSPSRFRMLAALLASNDPVPRFVETVLIQRLARFFEEKPNAIVALRSILHLARDIERSTADVEAFPWIATVLEAVEQARLAAEVALFSEGYLPSVEAARLIGDAEAAAARLRSLLADFHLAESTRREAIALARHASPLIEKNLIPIDAADQLEGAVDRLANLLEVPTQPIDLAELATYPARWREQARLVREAMAEFSRPFDSTALSRWWTWLEASDAGPKVLDEIDTLLKTPFLPADQRVEWWDARDRLARRLNNVTIEQNRRDDLAVREGGGAKLWVDPALRFDQRVAPISRDLIESWPMRWKMLSGNEESQSRSLPEQAKKLWAWQAARFAHLADMSIVGDRSFAKQVEQAFRRAAGPMVDPPVLEIDHVGDIALGRERLTATTQLRLRVRNVDGPVKFGLRLLTPDAGWLVVPESFTGELSPLKEKTLLINLAAGSKPHLFPEARGALVEARIGERVWYYPLPVLVGSLSSKFELYVKSTPQAAALPVTDLRLRPNLPPQAMTVLLANVSAKAQTVVAKVRDPVRETAVITIPPGQFKPLAFPPPAPVVPLVPPAPMGQPATPVADFQDLTGPLTVEILQADTRELLQVLTLPVRVADPSQYLTVDEVVFQPATAERGNRLGVRVKAESPLGAEPCLIQLSVPEDRNPGIVLRERKFQAILDNDMPSVTLYAEKIGLL
ncbi:MAG: hypothetical protein K8T89_11480, partial [Planctomycetes bacterium]|nr:hypothetical protein [Planctomycetota bacterium]